MADAPITAAELGQAVAETASPLFRAARRTVDQEHTAARALALAGPRVRPAALARHAGLAAPLPLDASGDVACVAGRALGIRAADIRGDACPVGAGFLAGAAMSLGRT